MMNIVEIALKEYKEGGCKTKSFTRKICNALVAGALSKEEFDAIKEGMNKIRHERFEESMKELDEVYKRCMYDFLKNK